MSWWEQLLRDVLAEASLLGLSWWERIAAVLLLALLVVLGRGALGAVGSIRSTPPPEAVPSDGSAPGDPTTGGGIREGSDLLGPPPPENESGSGG